MIQGLYVDQSKIAYRKWVFRSLLHLMGGEAWGIIKTKHFDLIILDMNMPERSGLEVLRLIRNEPGLGRLPVIFLTGNHDFREKESVFATGGDDYLVKSTNDSELEMRVKAQLKKTKGRGIVGDSRIPEVFQRSFRNYDSIDEMFTSILWSASRLTSMDFIIQSRVEGSHYYIENFYSKGELFKDGRRFFVSDTYCSKIFETGVPLLIEDINKLEEGERSYLSCLVGGASYIGMPLFVKGAVYGTLSAFSLKTVELDDFTVEVMKAFAFKIGYELEREKMKWEVQHAQQALVEERSLSSLSRMTGAIAHEMRQPLTAADLDLSEVVDSMSDNEERKIVSSARQRVKEALLIIRSIIKVYRGKDSEEREVDVTFEIKETLLLLGRKIKGVTVIFDHNKRVKMKTTGNLSRIFVNLLGNALESLSGKGCLKISTAVNGSCVQVVIEDNGPGISPRVLDGIFSPEFSTKKSGEGTGLGLWIAKTEMERIGGEISVESSPGIYTRFMVSIPCG